jgi:LPS sulfotransferase NodH
MIDGKSADTDDDRNKALTAQVNALSAEVNRLTGEVNDLTDRNNKLTGEINNLTRMRNIVGGQIEARTAAGSGSPAHPTGSRRQRRASFLIVSNMRSGSTWLETALGALPDVATDYEIKWGVAYEPSAAHLLIDEASPTVAQLLAALETDAPVTGSKLMFEPDDLHRSEFFKLRAKIGADVRIVHLIRSFREIFLSRRRGFFHRANTTDVPRKIGAHLKAAILAADFGQAAQPSEARPVPPIDCYEELKVYLQNDVWVRQLSEAGLPYLRVGYGEIAGKMTEIARFVGSEATADAVGDAMSHPAVLKLPPIAPDRLVSNMAEIDPLFEHFEGLRQHLVRGSPS